MINLEVKNILTPNSIDMKIKEYADSNVQNSIRKQILQTVF